MSSERTYSNRIDEIDESLRPLSFERAIVIDLRGAVVLTKDAQPDEPYTLRFTEEEIAAMRAVQGAVFIHNHPHGWHYDAGDPRHGGYSFSPEDIRLACKARIAEIRAVSPRYRYSMQPTANGWHAINWSVLEMIFRGEYSVVNRELTLRVIRGEITPSHLQANLLHLTWVRVASQLGLAYNRWQE